MPPSINLNAFRPSNRVLTFLRYLKCTNSCPTCHYVHVLGARKNAERSHAVPVASEAGLNVPSGDVCNVTVSLTRDSSVLAYETWLPCWNTVKMRILTTCACLAWLAFRSLQRWDCIPVGICAVAVSLVRQKGKKKKKGGPFLGEMIWGFERSVRYHDHSYCGHALTLLNDSGGSYFWSVGQWQWQV